jgi:hypothetical protein
VTWPDGIATAVLTAFALLITIHQHRSTTQPHHRTRRTEIGHGHQDTQSHRQQPPSEEDGS